MFSFELKLELMIDLSFLLANLTASFWLGACGDGSTAPRGGQEVAMTDENRGKTATAVVDITKYFMAGYNMVFKCRGKLWKRLIEVE